MGGILAIARAVGTIATVNVDSQNTSALWLINLIQCNLPLNESWSSQLTKDQELYFNESLDMSSKNPGAAAKAAALYAQYSADSASMNEETGYQATMVQDEKSQVRSTGNSMDNLYTLEGPIEQVLHQTTSTILSF